MQQEVISILFSQPSVHITDNTMTAVFDVSKSIGEVDLLTDRTVSVTVLQTLTLPKRYFAQVGSQPITYQTSNNGFLAMIGFAFNGVV
ncbi:hypothetical protein OH492_10620 [Vibrio chagasii]|nr:hypothetical protein [Vibrio chagasii]